MWLIGGLGGCAEAPEVPNPPRTNEPGVIVHPVADSLESTHSVVPVHRMSLEDRPLDEAPGWLREFPDERAVGVLDGPDDLVFGDLADATVLPDGRIVLLDVQYGQLRVFSAEMEPRARAGQFGDGPGEVAVPTSILQRESGGLLVVDRIGRLEPIELPSASAPDELP